MTCREHVPCVVTLQPKQKGTLGNNTIFGPVQDARALYTVDDTALLGKSILVVDKPRITVYRNTWRVHHNTVYWGTLKLAQRK